MSFATSKTGATDRDTRLEPIAPEPRLARQLHQPSRAPTMPAFLDLNGVSGATYRFRLAQEGNVRMAMAGNYVCVRAEESGFTVLSVAATNDPFSTERAWRQAVARRGATHLYTRLNVSAAVREAEQRDIAAYYRPRAAHRPREGARKESGADGLDPHFGL